MIIICQHKFFGTFHFLTGAWGREGDATDGGEGRSRVFFINKEGESHEKGVYTQKEFNFHTLALLDQSVWLASPWIQFLTYVMQVCLSIHPYPKVNISLFRSRMKKKANSKAIGKDIYTIERFESTNWEVQANVFNCQKLQKLQVCFVGGSDDLVP
jgi:hypothetical protein